MSRLNGRRAEAEAQGLRVNVAILGAGRIGKVHARAVSGNPDAVLVAVTDALPAAAESQPARSIRAIFRDKRLPNSMPRCSICR